MALNPSGVPSMAAIQDAIDEATEEDMGAQVIYADTSSNLTVTHALGKTPTVGIGSVTAPGYMVGYAEGGATTAKFWVRDSAGAAVPGGAFILTWLVK